MADAFQPLTKALSSWIGAHVSDGRTIWLAVSGGLDSMALFHAARTLDGTFGVLHVDHGLRPESAADMAFVRAEAERAGWPFLWHRVEGLADSPERRQAGLEAAARAARYGWMAETVGAEGIVLTAHHGDDQRETRLLHLLRGSGPESLSGMKAFHRDFGFLLGRPFLGSSKSELRSALAEAGLAWREDKTNVSPDFLRNRIRQELIPLMDSIRPGWDAGLKRWGALAGEWRSHSEDLLARSSSSEGVLPLDWLSRAPSPLQMVILWSRHFGFGPSQASALFDLSLEGTEVGRRRCSATHSVTRERDALVARPLDAGIDRSPRSWQPDPEAADGRAGEMTTPDGRLSWRLVSLEAEHRPNPADGTAELEWSRLSLPLMLRPWREGDRMAPLGMSGTQLVSDVLTQRKVPAVQRAGQWVVEQADGRLAWLVGHRIDRHAALQPDTDGDRLCLELRWTNTR